MSPLGIKEGIKLFLACYKPKNVFKKISINVEDREAQLTSIIPIVEEKNGLLSMEKGELIPLATVAILNPSSMEWMDEVMIKIKDKFPKDFMFLDSMEAKKFMSIASSSTDKEKWHDNTA